MAPRGGKKKKKPQIKNVAQVENERPRSIIKCDETQQRESRAQRITKPEDEIPVGLAQKNAPPNESEKGIRQRQPLYQLRRQLSQQNTRDFTQQYTHDLPQQYIRDFTQHYIYDFSQQYAQDFSQQYIQIKLENAQRFAETPQEEAQRIAEGQQRNAQRFLESPQQMAQWIAENPRRKAHRFAEIPQGNAQQFAENPLLNVQRLTPSTRKNAQQSQQQNPPQHLLSPVPNPEQLTQNSQQNTQQQTTEFRNEVQINQSKDYDLTRLARSLEDHLSISQQGSFGSHSQRTNIIRLDESDDEDTRLEGEAVSLPRQGTQAPIGTIDRHSQRKLFDTPEQKSEESVEEEKPAEKELTIMYQNRNILDLGGNLFGEFRSPVYWNDYNNRSLLNSKK